MPGSNVDCALRCAPSSPLNESEVLRTHHAAAGPRQLAAAPRSPRPAAVRCQLGPALLHQLHAVSSSLSLGTRASRLGPPNGPHHPRCPGSCPSSSSTLPSTTPSNRPCGATWTTPEGGPPRLLFRGTVTSRGPAATIVGPSPRDPLSHGSFLRHLACQNYKVAVPYNCVATEVPILPLSRRLRVSSGDRDSFDSARLHVPHASSRQNQDSPACGCRYLRLL